MSSYTTLKKLQKYAGYNAPSKIEQIIKKAYEGPVSQLITEGQRLREQAYPAFFQAFTNIGTSAADLSPSAALSAAIAESERAMSPY